MERYWEYFCLLCILLALSSSAKAQSGERVALFVVADVREGPERVVPVVEQVRAQLADDGRLEVRPQLSRGAGETTSMEEAKALGRAAVRQLGSQSPDVVLAEYAPKILRALTQVSAVTDGEGRAHLWNLCALEVHLLLSAGSSEDLVREAVLDCRRRFVDRPTLGKAWGQEVALAFEKHTAAARQAPLTVKSSPAGCDLRLYGNLVGVTPMVIDVTPGTQEVQIECQGRASAVHRVEVVGARDVVLRLGADAALVDSGGISWLRYEDGRGAVQGAEDASALAAEAGADSFVLVRAERSEVGVEWVRITGSLQGAAKVPVGAAVEKREAAIKSVFRREVAAVQIDRDEHPTTKPRRVWADYALGGGLFVAGAALSVYPLIAIARDGQCTDSSCDAVYRGKSAGGIAMLAGGALLAASGVAVVWIGPFGRRARVTVANGISLNGEF